MITASKGFTKWDSVADYSVQHPGLSVIPGSVPGFRPDIPGRAIAPPPWTPAAAYRRRQMIAGGLGNVPAEIRGRLGLAGFERTAYFLPLASADARGECSGAVLYPKLVAAAGGPMNLGGLGCACGGTGPTCECPQGLGSVNLPIVGDVEWSTIALAAVAAYLLSRFSGGGSLKERRGRAYLRREHIGQAKQGVRAAKHRLRAARKEPGFLF